LVQFFALRLGEERSDPHERVGLALLQLIPKKKKKEKRKRMCEREYEGLKT